ncbi:hypothetical protein OHB53_09480 [Streptomyces sp. NBC_00056]|uniref:DUF6650 family protein n=1 Tax=Streptomyces sp. NBC_00056 TaxID=2975633 RepID=UPI003243F85F
MGIRPTEISAFGFGVGWEFKKRDQEIAQELLDFLEDKRILTVHPNRPMEDAEACTASAQECRARLSDLLNEVPVKSRDLRTWLRSLREAFTTFVETSERGGFESESGHDRFKEALVTLHLMVQTRSDVVATRYKLSGLRLLR